MPPPLPLNSPDAVRGAELAVEGMVGIRWKVVGVNARGASGRGGRTVDDALITMRSVPRGTTSGMTWRELKPLLVSGTVVIL